MAAESGPKAQEAVAAQAQSRGESSVPSSDAEAPLDPYALLNKTFVLDPIIESPRPEPYERTSEDPLYRPLRIYTVDPSVPKLEGAVALVDVPYEPLEPGPEGRLLRIDNSDRDLNVRYRRADLEAHSVLLTDGYAPSQTDPRFHQQMVYAVCSNVYAAFRKALGRQLHWGPKVQGKLNVFPDSGNEKNAYYDEAQGELRFGYFEAEEKPSDDTLPGGFVFTCLSHDIIAHEVTHALLDGLRAHFTRPSSPDVLAFHEAFADLIAVFQRFSYKDVVHQALRTSHGEISKAHFLTGLAFQFGNTTGRKSALRTAVDTDALGELPKQLYDPTLEAHDLGAVLVAAVFEAFVRIYLRKTERYFRLASGGTGILPPGELPTDLQDMLAEKASSLASQFMSICIRAIDYCPPVSINFGEYLRALITADRDLVPDDPWDYRGALIEAFRKRNIYPRDVANLSEDSLLWRPTRVQLKPVAGLSFGKLNFRGDPAADMDMEERRRQACIVGEYVSRPEHLDEFGLVANGDPRLNGDEVSLPCVHSVRSSRRIGPDGQVVFDLIAEVSQRRAVRHGPEHFDYDGGATIILGPRGEVRYTVLKSVVGTGRLERRREYLRGAGRSLWDQNRNLFTAKTGLFRLLHSS